MQSLKIIFISIMVILIPSLSQAVTRYVDATAGACTGNYSIANRNCSGSNGNSYATVQAGVSAMQAGDTLYIRGGHYTENVQLPNINGTAWTAGNFQTVASYAGEWAHISATSNTGYVIYRPTGGSQTANNPNAYWKFERLEISGGRFGIVLSQGPFWIRYCYVHDVNYGGNCDDLAAGIWINQSTQSIIEYNYISGVSGSPSTVNCAALGFDSDYNDDYRPTEFNPNLCSNRNIVRYNLVESVPTGITHKNQQRFGTDTRTASGIAAGAYRNWGDLWHHNIVRNLTDSGPAIKPDQDNAQVYNNIVYMDSASSIQGIQFGREDGLSSHQPILYNPVFFNNTVIKAGKSYGYFAGGDALTSWAGVGWFYNNISDQDTIVADGDNWQSYVFTIAADMASGSYADLSNFYLKNSLIHSPTWGNDSPNVFLRGRASTYTLAGAQSAFSTISGNWQNTTANLYRGATGADAITTSGTFVLNGATTIANGGIGGVHPYRTDMPNFPSYVGATNPADYSWVAGVLGLNSTYFTSQSGGSDPTWVEGTSGSPSTPTNFTGAFGQGAKF